MNDGDLKTAIENDPNLVNIDPFEENEMGTELLRVRVCVFASNLIIPFFLSGFFSSRKVWDSITSWLTTTDAVTN